MTPIGWIRNRMGLGGALVSGLALALSACGSPGSPTFVAGPPDTGVDSSTAPPDGGGGDSIPTPGIDSTPVPPDSLAPPVDSVVRKPFTPGIPFGFFGLPSAKYGTELNAVLKWTSPSHIMTDLEAARRGGARIILRLAGSHVFYRSNGSFDMDKWKARVDRYHRFDISSYIQDGTLVGHLIMDEPHDPKNWGGNPVPPKIIDEVAKYSKQLWPGLPTVVRSWPAYLKGYHYQYLDVAWAQYSERFGPIEPFVEQNVRDAKSSGLALLAGLNAINGGTKASGIKGQAKGKFAMSANQIRTWGSVLLAEPYVCGFLSWQYDATYFEHSDIAAAFDELSRKARSHPELPCRHS